MSTESALARLSKEQYIEGQLSQTSTRNLVPKRTPRTPDAQHFSVKALIVTILVHAAVFTALIIASTREPHREESAPPIMVSLVQSPEPVPEVAITEPEPQPTPKPPQPKPKPKPKPKVVDKPVPIEAPQPVEQVEEVREEVSEPQPQEAQQAPSQAPVQDAPVVAERIEPVPPPEPKEQPIPEVAISGVSYSHQEIPVYPAMSRRLGEQGVVMLRILISETGVPESIEIESSSGSERLDKAALEATKKSRFNPYKRNNKPMKVSVIAPVRFSIAD
ncbi:energy transducer TonB [Methylobacillus flagellatus]|uniref:Protein TonB n=1 Tax=Methylobacillus flagellatus (strain ATCC 51484 / DSM 6875 / VKM B-1610 / KT) TaxID=265072 RepID=Q1H2J9_METFK|nr:energy transducer TonB [Methylobacillus flagellatus]ABE49144.1 outer membrane transport energization protein TonB [Methylobacillus flagellatus KT]ABE49288.1 outer membrane transport energization protein TonB [Methylobacillus flagellatus KT]